MITANVLDAKNNLSGFLRMLETGQEECIVIARHGKPVARLVPLEERKPRGLLGIARGEVLYNDGWDSDEFNAEIAAMLGAE